MAVTCRSCRHCDGGKAVERIEPEGLNDTDGMELRVFSNEAYRHAVLVARLDNLGKGASGRGGAEYPADAGARLRFVRAGLPCVAIRRSTFANGRLKP